MRKNSNSHENLKQVENLKQKLSLANARTNRLKKARQEAELLLEKKSRELFEANQKLELAQGKLEDDVKQATYELSVSNQRLQAALNERSTFIGQMSHEVRTPLNAIIGLSEILHHTNLDDAQKDYIETINSGAKSLIVLLNDMLDITKIEAGRVDIDPQPTNSRRIHQNIIAMFELDAKERGLKLDVNIHDSVPGTVRIDKGRYKQIINNLISNALKNTKKGQVLVDVTYEPDAISKRMGVLIVKVIDSGVGIPKDQLTRIFNAYEQIGRPNQGVGLGLAICQQLSELMMGKISCKSEVGNGSTFKLSLPVEQLSDHEKNQTSGVTSELPPLSPLRILVAEDNPINQKVITAQLSQLGQKADIVNNGAEALSQLEKKDYDVVVLDILMPVMDGEQAIKTIRNAKPSVAQHYCIALTASTYQNQRERLLELGFDAFLSKPLSLSELSSALNDVPKGLYVSMNADIPLSFRKSNTADDLSTQESFDYGYLETQFGAAYKIIFNEIAPTFLEYAYQDLEKLKESIDSGNVTQIQRTSHSIKGAASSIGLSDLANVLLKIESKPDDPAIHQQLEVVDSMMQRLKPLIELELKSKN